MIKYVMGMQFLALCIVACRAVVKESKALAGLEAMAKEYVFHI
jgi:hypothetical protein